tara:strand:+ start:5820 stop:6611 length:792 start_codon:yes stop_codon:yes gene_type:complete
MEVLNYLKKKNLHSRDENTNLDEETHIYNIKGVTDYTSMTTLIHSLFEKFNDDKIITNMMKSKNWKTNNYYGMSREEIKELWQKNNKKSTDAGTKIHYDIECFYNNIVISNSSKEFEYFMNFHNDIVVNGKLKPYRTEWIVYGEDIKIAGSIDMIFKKGVDKNGKEILDIYDWKRCKEITKTSGFNKWSTNEYLEHIPDTNYWHYSLQLNGYKYILENYYDKVVEDLYLVCLHPDNKNKNYILIKVPDLQEEIKDVFLKRIVK